MLGAQHRKGTSPIQGRGATATNATGSEIICCGFNCRPIARMLSEAGHRPVVIDYFGDLDIRPHAAEGHYFLDEAPGPKDADHFRAWALATLDRLARHALSRDKEKPLVLPGSGFDDEPEAWKRFTSLGRVLGSKPEAVARARDVDAVAALLRETASPIRVPATRLVHVDAAMDPAAAAREVGDELAFPVVVKRTHTAGGAGIELAEGPGSLEGAFRRAMDGLRGAPGPAASFYVQEYVGGIGASDASVLAIGGRVVCKTRQIIGDSRLHAPMRFSYCGNSMPFDTGDAGLDDAIDTLVVALHRDFGLDGLYGIDMVLAGGKVHLVEINPRVPGSAEPASASVGRNLMADHVDSFLSPGSLPRRYIPARHAVKQVLFAAKDFTMPALGQLAIHGEVHDITPPGTIVPAGTPVVTCLHHGPLGEAEAVDAVARQDIKAIYAFLERDWP